MNDQITPIPSAIMNGAPEWLTLPFVLIGLGVLFALFILWRGTVLAKRRAHARAELEERGEVAEEPTPEPVVPSAPPVAPAPPPIADAPTVETLPIAAEMAPEPERKRAEEEAGTTTEAPAPLPEQLPVEPAPEPEPLADEPIAAAAPLDAAPAALAASEPGADTPVASDEDDLTRMKGVGPRLADRLNAVGITRFAQLAALTPAEAEALDARLGDFQGRIHRDRWIEQAGFLARGDIAGYEAVFGKL